MKKIFIIFTILMFLFLPAIIFAQVNTTTTTTTQTSCCPICLPGSQCKPCDGPPCLSVPTSLKDVYNFFTSINPFVLLIFGIILFVVSHLSKYVAIVLIIFAVIQIILMIIR